MSIAGVYVQIVDGRERYKSFAFRLKRSADDQLIRLPCQDRRLLAEMAPKTPSKSETLANRIKNFFTAPSKDDEDVQPQEEPKLAAELQHEDPAKTPGLSFKLKEKKCCKKTSRFCCGCRLASRILYFVLSVLAVFKGLGLIVAGGVVAVAVKAYDTEHTGKAAALLVLVVSAGVTVVLVIWSAVAYFKKQSKQTKQLALFLFLLGLFQLILTLTAITPNARSQERLTQELTESFEKAKNGNQKHMKQWAATQFGLSCCGLHSPDQYRSLNLPPSFPPNVPISCCPAFDPDRPALTQERERELCKARRQYYKTGCVDPLVTYFAEAGVVVTSLVSGLFFIQIFFALWTYCCGRSLKQKKTSVEAPNESVAATGTPATPATPTA